MNIKKFEELNEEATNGELLRYMISLSNNSRLTQESAVMLSNTLGDEEMRKLIQWFRHANSEIDIKISNAKRNKFY